MKENIKIVLGVIIAVVVSVSGSIFATTMLSSDKVSYSNKSSASGSTTVSGALDDLYDAVDINERLGNTDIGGKTITQSISELNSNLAYSNRFRLIKTEAMHLEKGQSCALSWYDFKGQNDIGSGLYLDGCRVLSNYLPADWNSNNTIVIRGALVNGGSHNQIATSQGIAYSNAVYGTANNTSDYFSFEALIMRTDF